MLNYPCLIFSRVVQIKVVSFQDLPVDFKLKTHDDKNSDVFDMDQNTGRIALREKLSHISDIQQYRLKV